MGRYSGRKLQKGRTPKLTSNFRDSTDTVISANDFIRDFVDQSLIATNSDKDRIGKDEMKTAAIH